MLRSTLEATKIGELTVASRRYRSGFCIGVLPEDYATRAFTGTERVERLIDLVQLVGS
jgi:hypothetical protein